MSVDKMECAGAKEWRKVAVAVLGVFAMVEVVEALMGRLLLGPDGKFGWWEGDIWSKEISQRFADPYSFSHLTHGFLLFGLLWMVARRIRLPYRMLFAVFIEAGWELLENSPLIIERYRHVTISLGYNGDSILNSSSDILMMIIGFLMASRLPWWAGLVAVLVMEIGCGILVRDNLTLNIIMLIHPVAAIKAWQTAGMPHPP